MSVVSIARVNVGFDFSGLTHAHIGQLSLLIVSRDIEPIDWDNRKQGLAGLNPVSAACCYFSAKNADILQPAQKVFITWDPAEKVETFTVQPKFEGNALDFGMVIPTPSQPKLHEMPRDFFKHLAIYTIMKKREFPQSKLVFVGRNRRLEGLSYARGADVSKAYRLGEKAERPKVIVLEAGVVGSLDYKIIEANRADDLFQ